MVVLLGDPCSLRDFLYAIPDPGGSIGNKEHLLGLLGSQPIQMEGHELHEFVRTCKRAIHDRLKG